MPTKNKTYAITGASNNPEKYGNIVLQDLKNSGFKVIPINLKEEEILGLKVYKSVLNYPKDIDIAVTIVPPEVTEQVVKEVKEKGIKMVWMQPGSESDAAIQFCKDNGIEVKNQDCIMLAKQQ